MGEVKDKDKDKVDCVINELVMDQCICMILFKMISCGIVSEVYGVISIGKEVNVYGVVLDFLDGICFLYCVIKIYKMVIFVFKDRERYIIGEYRFKRGVNKKNNWEMVK